MTAQLQEPSLAEMDGLRANAQLVVHGAFAWVDWDSRKPWLTIDGGEKGFDGVVISDNALGDANARPKWWQLRRRYQLLRAAETLPVTQIVMRAEPPIAK